MHKTMSNTASHAQVAELDDILGWGTAAAPFVVALAFSPINHDYFGLPKFTALLLATLFLLYIQLRRWFAAGRLELVRHPALIPAGAVLLVAGVTALVSATPLASIVGRFNRYEGIASFICYAFLFWLFLKGGHQKGLLARRFYRIFRGVFAVTVAIGLGEALGLSLPGAALRDDGRIASTLGNPVFFGAFLSMSLPLLCARALFARHDERDRWDHPALTGGLVCAGLATLALTQSRGAWLGVLAAFLVLAYFVWCHRGTVLSSRRLGRGLAAALLIIIASTLIVILSASALRSDAHRVLDAAGSSQSLKSRVAIWQSSLSMIADRPLTGYGLDQTKDWFGPYMTERLARIENALHDRAHNIYLQAMLDGGVLLLLAQLWLVAYALLGGARSAKRGGDYLTIGAVAAVAGYLVQGFTGIATNELSVVYWCLLGLLAGTATPPAVREYSLPGRAASHTALGRVVAVPLVALTVATVFPLVAEARYYSCAREAEVTMSTSMLEQAYDASSYLAQQPYYQWHIAYLCLEFARKKENVTFARRAAAAAQRGLRYAPESPELIYILGSSHLTAAQFGGGEADLRRARTQLERMKAKSPRYLGLWEDLLEFYVQQGDYSNARTCARRIREFDHSNPAPYVVQAIVHRSAGNKDKADELLKRALRISPRTNEMEKRLTIIAAVGIKKKRGR